MSRGTCVMVTLSRPGTARAAQCGDSTRNFIRELSWNIRMMINHSTLDYHVTNFNMFSRRTNKNPNVTLYSDLTLTYTLTLTKTLTLTIAQTLTLTWNLTFFLIWPCHVISHDQPSFWPITSQRSFFTLRHVGWFGISVQKYVDLI